MADLVENPLSMEKFSLNRVEIDLAALQHNFRMVQQTVKPQTRIMTVVKADAYGHGMLECAKGLYRAGARSFGVAEVWEGVELRRAGIEGEIIVLLGCGSETYEEIIDNNLIPVVYDIDNITGLSRAAVRKNRQVNVHLKVDVGMGRLGVLPSEVESLQALIRRMPAVTLTGLLSHFPVADESEAQAKTREQLASFKEVLTRLKENKNAAMIAHIANSAALFYFPETHLDMIRPGISLYGYFPDASPARAKIAAPDVELKPVMSFKTRIIQVKELAAGSGISYGHTFITRRRSRIAVLPVGYSDGYIRKLSNRAEVLIRGRRAPVCGRICMNATMVDITDLPMVESGEEVVLLGRQGDGVISADEIADWLESISYEVLCLFGSCNEKIYRNS